MDRPRPVAGDAPRVCGALVVDKPAGSTSHDVVAAVRRALGGVKIGHTGTLDPIATGVLPLLVGRATRLAPFMAAAVKRYDAEVQFGWATDTYDAAGTPVGPAAPAAVAREPLERVLGRFRGDFVQQPPAFSAKKVAGTRAYKLARADRPPQLTPVPVTVHALSLTRIEGSRAWLSVTCSAGFYVRSLAHDLGQALGTGAHLCGLRRVASGSFTLADAVPLEDVLREPAAAAARVIPSGRLLPELPAVRLTEAAVGRVAHGRDVGADDVEDGGLPAGARAVRLLAPDGALAAIGIAAPGSAFLHPAPVLV